MRSGSLAYCVKVQEIRVKPGPSEWRLSTHLVLQRGALEAEQQRLAVLGPQMIYAPCIDGAHQVLIDLILGILVTLRAVTKSESARESDLFDGLVVAASVSSFKAIFLVVAV